MVEYNENGSVGKTLPEKQNVCDNNNAFGTDNTFGDVHELTEEQMGMTKADEKRLTEKIRKIRGEKPTKSNQSEQNNDAYDAIFEPDAPGSAQLDRSEFKKSMIKTERIRPAKEGDDAVYRFTFCIDGVTRAFTIPLGSIRDNIGFDNKLMSNFGMHLPYELMKKSEKGQVSNWSKFVRLIETECDDIDPEDSQEWMEADVLLDYIASHCKITADAEEWAGKSFGGVKKLLVDSAKGKKYLLIKSADMAEILKNEVKLTLKMAEISNVLDGREIKRRGNPPKTIQQKQSGKVWWIDLDALVSRGAVIDEGESATITGMSSLTKEGY
jgi:hypothetical protein